VASEFPDVLFVVAGKGPSRQLIENRIKELGIGNNIMLTGFVPDELLPVYYNASDYFVLPSASGEGLPLVLFEAMACGLPVVATTVGGTPEIVEQMKNGVLVPARNPKRMAEALLELLKNEKLTETIGERARTDIVSRFSWDENARKLGEVYRQFLS
jgi:glycosyltransferase involved in cell wall biosynthesis